MTTRRDRRPQTAATAPKVVTQNVLSDPAAEYLTPSSVRSAIVRIADYQPHPRNYNGHPARQIEAIAASLRKFGQPRPVAVWRGYYLAGHGVVAAARSIGWTTIRADVLPDDYPEHLALAYLAADNELARLSDPDEAALVAIMQESRESDPALLAAMGYSDQEFAELLERAGMDSRTTGDTEPQIDRAEELRQKWQTAPGQLWQLGDHRLICGDCTDAATVARVMGGEKAQFCVTSPPYSGAEMWTEETDELIRISHNCLAVIRDFSDPGSALCWNTADVPTGQNGMAINIAIDTIKAIELGWRKRAELIWRKGLSYLPYPWNTRRPCVPNITHESILVFFNGERKARESEGNLNTEQLLWNRESVWDFVSEKASKVHHKAPFPLDIPTRCISLFSFSGDLVYEPFSGSGTTIIACENLARRCRAVEISPAYVAVALERYATHTGDTPRLLEPAP